MNHEACEQKRQALRRRDIPVDEGPLVGKQTESRPVEKKEHFFNRKAAVPTPDQVLAGVAGEAPLPPGLRDQRHIPAVRR